MGFTVQGFLALYLIPFSMVLTMLMILPFPRFIKKVAFSLVELRIKKISKIKIGVMYCILCGAICLFDLITYIQFEESKMSDIERKEAEEHCLDLKNCNIMANMQNRKFRNLLIFGLGFLISVMNFILASRNRKIFALEDERDELKKKQ
ncbi:unnamed protein product [Moneuplotes crassus]|uniref:BAP29/BAP31 transmembrane domain-containing protein n=1 Tax=Euplotes crassus TaxID=5936 RepID=A0AAD2D4Z5_EUPCR|nr:unnamed protein product [Moneuplotes crassus]